MGMDYWLITFQDLKHFDSQEVQQVYHFKHMITCQMIQSDFGNRTFISKQGRSVIKKGLKSLITTGLFSLTICKVAGIMSAFI